ncbi:MAG: hemin receptor [Verrucomicrobia bacterium]|nr:hemin receptor [Verrucomicrobiota bacterium]
MNFDQKQLVQNSWEKVLPISDTAATLFYGRLFELDPSTRPLFKDTNMAQQRKKLIQVIGTVVNGLNRLDQLIPAVSNLGRRHVAYGVRDEHYSSVGKALIWTLEQGLGADFTPEVREAWTTVYAVLAETMKNAMTPAEV